MLMITSEWRIMSLVTLSRLCPNHL